MRTATFFRALWVRLSLLATTGLLATPAAHAQTAPDWASVQRGSSNLGTSSGTGVAVAADGSQYVTGSFENTFTLGAVTLTAGAGRSHVFLAKYSATGVVLWATQLDCAGTNLFGTLAVDAAGNVYLAGPFATSVTLGGTTLTAASDSFLAKYSPQGVLQWARQGGGTSTSVRCIATDAAGNVAIAGGYSGYVNFGVGVTNSGTSGCFFYRLSPTGSVLQGTNVATQVGTSPFSATVFPNALAFDGAGNAYIAGGFYGTMAFGAMSLTAAFSSSTDSFLCKLDAAAAPVWAVADASTRNVGGLAVDAAGNAVVCGTPDIYLARFTPQGVRQWSRRITATGTGTTVAYKVVADGRGGYYATGQFGGTAVFSATTLTAIGQQLFVARFDSQGNAVWADRAVGTAPMGSVGYGLAADAGGNTYVTGILITTVSLGSLTSSGGTDAFLAKLTAGGILTATRPATAGLALAAYPNPASGSVTLRLPVGGGQLAVLDAVGRTVRRQALPATPGPCPVSLAGLDPGLYQVRATLGNGQLATAPLAVE